MVPKTHAATQNWDLLRRCNNCRYVQIAFFAFTCRPSSVEGAFSGLLAYGIAFMKGIRGFEGWSWIFVGALAYAQQQCTQFLADHRRNRNCNRWHYGLFWYDVRLVLRAFIATSPPAFCSAGRLPRYCTFPHFRRACVCHMEEE